MRWASMLLLSALLSSGSAEAHVTSAPEASPSEGGALFEVSSSYSAPVYGPQSTPFDCWPDEGTALGCS